MSTWGWPGNEDPATRAERLAAERRAREVEAEERRRRARAWLAVWQHGAHDLAPSAGVPPYSGPRGRGRRVRRVVRWRLW